MSKRAREDDQGPIDGESKAKKARKSLPKEGADFDGLLDCPVCTEIMLPPILQCKSGHAICTKCHKKVSNKCPTCRVAFGAEDIRCLMLEQVAARFITPCKYVDSGCDARLDYERKAVHERDCEFRPVRCLINDCKWEGRPSALAAHMTGNECSIIVGDNRGINFASGEIAHLGLCGHDGLNGWVVFLLKAFDHDFICYIDYEDDQYRASIAICGHLTEAQRFRSTLCVRAPDRPTNTTNVPEILVEGSGGGGGSDAGVVSVPVPAGSALVVSTNPPVQLAMTSRPLTIFELQEDRKLDKRVHLRFSHSAGHVFARKVAGSEMSKIDFWGKLMRL